MLGRKIKLLLGAATLLARYFEQPTVPAKEVAPLTDFLDSFHLLLGTRWQTSLCPTEESLGQ